MKKLLYFLVLGLLAFSAATNTTHAVPGTGVKIQKDKKKGEDREPPLPKQFQEEDAEQKPFWDDMQHGWYWYEKDPEKNLEDPDQPQKYVPSVKDYTMEELWTMHPDDFQALITAIHKKSVQYPTEENVKDFVTMLDITRRRGGAYVNVYSTVLMKHPEFIVSKDYPRGGLGDNTKVTMQNTEIDEKINNSSADFGLIYFYSETCEFCRAQDGVIKYFLERFPWLLKRVEISRAPEIASHFNIETVPLVLLVSKESGQSLPISVGVVALNTFKKNLYKGIRLLSGEVTPEEFNMYEYQRDGVFDPNARR